MYEIIKSVIKTGRYELADMLAKIDTVWLQGELTDEQRMELIESARQNASPENSYPTLQKQIDGIYANLAEMAQRITALEGGTVTPEEWPEYIQPASAHDAYHVGDKVTYQDKRYICQMDGCVWPPDVYPDGWEEVITEEETIEE